MNCPICFDGFKLDDNMRELNCKHIFCEECSIEWFDDNIKCPVCMKDFS